MRAIEATGVIQRFGERIAVGPLNVSLEAGSSLAVLGQNGSGKSTLLRMLATAARPAAGHLTLLGLDATTERTELRRRIGFVGERAGHYPALTALENLEFFCDLHGLARSRAGEAIELVGLGASRRRRAGELSKGASQRLAIARALLHAPALLILDEPEAGLDDGGRELLQTIAAGRTMVLATHDRQLASRLCREELDLSSQPVAAFAEAGYPGPG